MGQSRSESQPASESESPSRALRASSTQQPGGGGGGGSRMEGDCLEPAVSAREGAGGGAVARRPAGLPSRGRSGARGSGFGGAGAGEGRREVPGCEGARRGVETREAPGSRRASPSLFPFETAVKRERVCLAAPSALSWSLPPPFLAAPLPFLCWEAASGVCLIERNLKHLQSWVCCRPFSYRSFVQTHPPAAVVHLVDSALRRSCHLLQPNQGPLKSLKNISVLLKGNT